MGVGSLKHGVEGLENVAVAVFKLAAHVEHVEYRFVILVYQYHSAAACLGMRSLQNLYEPSAKVERVAVRHHAVFFLPVGNITVYTFLQNTGLREVGAVEVNMEHRINVPLLLHTVDGKTLEKILAAKVVVLQRRHKQTLSETARTAQEVDSALMREVVNHVRLVYINVSVFYNPVEALYSYWVFHLCVSPLYDSSLNKRPVARLICQYSERREQRENKNAFLVLALPSRILYILMQIYAILFE